ncbi:hypothetical protein ITJ66_16435 [Plantibacter sp. VKM Ac-2885]|uniref:response regulator transcription factor n=1 Tax=Plantibacter sp. VKM Ac-2885 TaxID=2783828 RepID=UPI00188AE5A0|nr:helix-turn-helix transcriptional regulator [Plantibacter sp. VKM Ac-2885]MBF4514074.1 hypothetical protein [Plantibacter sp. VKM Ac-2885]
MARSQDWEAFAAAIDNSFFARLLVEPDALLEGFAAASEEWLWENPRYLMAGAIASAVSNPYGLVPARVFEYFATWVERQDRPTARDRLGVMHTQLRVLVAAGRLADADEQADASLRLVAESQDTDGFDDLLPPVFTTVGLVKLLRGDLREAIGIFMEGTRRADATDHPCTPHISNFAALAYALVGNFALAEDALREVPSPDQSTGPMHAFYYTAAQYAAALISLGCLRTPSVGHYDHEPGTGALWWIAYHIRAKAALTASERPATAAVLEDVLDMRRDLTGAGTLAGSTLRVDLANLYMASHNYQAAAHVLQDLAATNSHESVWSAKARLALLTGQPERALNLISAAQHLQGGRHRLAPSLLITKAAAQRLLGDITQAGDALEWAADSVRRTNGLREVIEAHPSIRTELAEKVSLAHELPDEVYSRAEVIELTKRQREVLGVLDQHRSIKQIAAALHVSPDTAKSHLAAVYKKLGVHSREQALRVVEDWRLS